MPTGKVTNQGLIAALYLLLALFSLPLFSTQFTAGDVAPYGNPDGQLTVGDVVVLQRFLNGSLTPTTQEQQICDVAPVGNVNGILDTGDLLVFQRAILGLVTLPPVSIGPDAPVIVTTSGSTSANPFTINGTALPDIEVRLYVNGVLQTAASADATGNFTFQAALYDGSNSLYATAWDGQFESEPSASITIDYTNSLNRNIGGSGRISSDTVWTPGVPPQPYTVTKILTIQPGVTLTIMPDAEIQFKPDTGLDIEGQLNVRGASGSPVLLKGDPSVTPSNRWYGIQTLPGATGITMDYAEMELSRYGVLASEGAISITNSIFQNIDNPVVPAVDVDVVSLSGTVSSAILTNNQFLGSTTGNDHLAAIHLLGVDATIAGNLIDGFDNGIRVGSGSSPAIGPDNTITNNVSGIRIEPQAGANDDPAPVIFNNSLYSNTYNLYAGTGFDDPAVWWIDAQANWWGSSDPVAISQSIYDYSNAGGIYADNIPSVDYTRFLDAPGGTEASGNYLFGRITSDTTLAADTNYIVLGKLAVAPTVNLTISQGTQLEFVPEASLTSYGNLSLAGTIGHLVKLSGVSWNTALKWGGIRALDASMDTSITYADIERANTDGVYLARGDITYSHIHDNGTGISVYWQNGVSQINDPISIMYNHIIDNATNGIKVAGVSGCASCGPNPDVWENVIFGSSRGIDLTYAAGLMVANNIIANDTGIHIFGFDSFNDMVIDNAYYHSGDFIPDKEFIPNEISGGNIGVRITGGRNGSVGYTWVAPQFQGNYIFDNAAYNVQLAYTGYSSFTNAFVFMSNHWWGTADTAQVDAKIYDANDVGVTQPEVYYGIRSSGPIYSAPVLDFAADSVTQESYTIAGTGEANTDVQVYVNDILQQTVTADPSGVFTATVTLAPGMNAVHAITSDGLGVSNPSKPVYVQFLPTVFPSIPTLNPAVTTTNDNPFTIAGFTQAGATVNIYVNGLFQDAVIADGDGLFSYTAILTDGQNSIFVSEVTGASQTAASNTVTVEYVNNIANYYVDTIDKPRVWTSAGGNSYVVRSMETITPGAYLYIEPGTIVEFWTGGGLIVEGTLIVDGTPEAPVIFKSENGIQNFDQWKQIEVRSGGYADIRHATIEYSNKGVWFNGGSGSVSNSYLYKNRYGITTQDEDGSVSIEANRIEFNEAGITVGRNSSPQITNLNKIYKNTKYGIDVIGALVAGEDPNPLVNGNNVYSNTTYSYRATQFNDPSAILDAENNWWGTANMATIPNVIYDQSDNPAGSPVVDFDPPQPALLNTTVPTAPTLTGCNSPTSQPDCVITGTAQPGRTIQLYVNGIAAETTTADPTTGAFSLQTTLPLTGTNLLYARAMNGAIEGPQSNTVSVVLDNAPPVITLTQPAPGAQVNYAVIAGHLDEPATVTVAGESATVFPDNSFAHALAGLADGPHTVQIVATDSFGQSSNASVTFTLDSQPPATPDTGQITVGTPSGGQVTVSSPAGTATAGDTVTLLNSRTGTIVQATVQGDGSYSAQIAAAAGDDLVITITDPAGNTTASRVLTVAGTPATLGVNITTPADGATVDADSTGLTGTFQGPANVGIEVNGYTATKDGTDFCVGDIPLQTGNNTVTVTARTPDGASSSQQVTVSSTGPSPLQLEVDRVSGIAPLTVTYSLTDNTGLNLDVIDYDVDGDGNSDYSTNNAATTITHTYTTPGCYTATVNAQDPGSGGSATSSRTIAVQDVQHEMGAPLAVYYGMLEAMRNQDASAVARIFTEGSQNKYQSIFTTLYSDLPAVADSLGSVSSIEISNDIAEITVIRVKNGVPYAYSVFLVRDIYGVWKVDSM